MIEIYYNIPRNVNIDSRSHRLECSLYSNKEGEMMKNICRVSFIIILLLGVLGLMNEEVEATQMEIEFQVELIHPEGAWVPDWDLRITDNNNPNNFADLESNQQTGKVTVETIDYNWMDEGVEVTFSFNPDDSSIITTDLETDIHSTWDGITMQKCTVYTSYSENEWYLADMLWYMKTVNAYVDFTEYEPESALRYGSDNKINIEVSYYAVGDDDECGQATKWKYFRMVYESTIYEEKVGGDDNVSYDCGVLELEIPPGGFDSADPYFVHKMTRGVHGAGTFYATLEVTCTEDRYGNSQGSYPYDYGLSTVYWTSRADFTIV